MSELGHLISGLLTLGFCLFPLILIYRLLSRLVSAYEKRNK